MMRPRSLSFFVVLVCSFAWTQGAIEVSASPQDFVRRLVSAAIAAEMEMDFRKAGQQHRSSPRSEFDGIFRTQG
jgi:hypothetical protein